MTAIRELLTAEHPQYDDADWLRLVHAALKEGPMTVTDAAQVLGLSPRTLQEQIKRGRIKAVRHGPIWWITDAEVERYRAESKGKPGRRQKV